MLHLDSEWTVADLDDGEEGCNFTPLIENFKQRNGHLGDPYPPPPLGAEQIHISVPYLLESFWIRPFFVCISSCH